MFLQDWPLVLKFIDIPAPYMLRILDKIFENRVEMPYTPRIQSWTLRYVPGTENRLKP